MVFLVVSVVGLVGVSSSMWTGLGFAAHYDQICSVQVVNEFPHDPGAFTEVSPHLGLSLFGWFCIVCHWFLSD